MDCRVKPGNDERGVRYGREDRCKLCGKCARFRAKRNREQAIGRFGRKIMRCAASAVAMLGLQLLAVPVSSAQAADQADRAAAIKEGNVNWYTSTPFPLVQVLAD